MNRPQRPSNIASAAEGRLVRRGLVRCAAVWMMAAMVGCQIEVELQPIPVGGGPTGAAEDLDQDGFTAAEGDCDDLDPAVAPDLDEVCDGLDNDCRDGVDSFGVCDRHLEFQQSGRLDVLVVVDTSAPRWREGALAAVPELAREFTLPGADVHLGVLTTNMARAGLVEVNGVPVIQSSRQLEMQSWLDAAFQVTDHGHLPRGLDVLARSLADPLLVMPAEILRPEAHLEVLFLLGSPDESAATVDMVLESLRASRGSLRNLTIDGVGPLPWDSCDDAAVPSAHFTNLADATGGTVLSVCEPDPGPFISAVAQTASENSLQDRFDLGAVVDAASLRVQVRDNFTGLTRMVPDQALALADENQTLIFLEVPPPLGTTVVVDFELAK